MLAVRAMAATEDLPMRANAEAVGLHGEDAPGPIRQVILRVTDHPEEREATTAVLLRMAEATDEPVVLHLLGAAMLAIGAGPGAPEGRRGGGAGDSGEAVGGDPGGGLPHGIGGR